MESQLVSGSFSCLVHIWLHGPSTGTDPQIPPAACFCSFTEHTFPFPFSLGPAYSHFVVLSHVMRP